MMNALEVRNISKRYERFTLKDISFTLPMGTITGLVGRNGAGKTTTIKSILNVVHPDSGSCCILGQNGGTEILQEVGVVYDECCFSEVLTPVQLEKVLRKVYKKWSTEFFFGICERYQLPMKQKIKTYSRGMKQKLSIAAVLSYSPRLLFLDEPTGGLDPVARGEILEDLQTYIEDGEHTVMLSTHITSDLDRIADRIIYLSNGEKKIDEEKDILLEEYCILRGAPENLSSIEEQDILGIRKGVYSFEALCKGRMEMQKKYPQMVCDRADIEQILVLLEGGNNT